jgi:divalent metal cation (Fe/Co/Zn/Cd) transporter
MLAIGWRLVTDGSLFMGLFLFAAGVVTAYLALRRLRAAMSGPAEAEFSGELRRPEFDYLVWAVIGLPILLVLALLAYVLAGNRN